MHIVVFIKETNLFKLYRKIQVQTHREHTPFPLWRQLMLCAEMLAVYCENYMNHINALCG